MRVLITTVQVPFVRGGAETHAEGLCQALRTEGHEAEIAAIPFKGYPPERIIDQMLACRLLDLTESYGLLRLCREAIRYRPHSVSYCLAARVAADLETWAGRPAEMLSEQIAGPIVDLTTLAV